MNSLLVRSYLGAIVFAILSFIVTGVVLFETVFEQDEWQDFKEEVAVDHQLLMLKLTQSPKQNWEELVIEHEAVFDMHISLIDDAQLSPTERLFYDDTSQRKFYSDLDEEDWYTLFKLPQSDFIIKIEESETPFEELNLADKLDFFIPIILVGLTQLFGVILLLRMIRRPVDDLAESAIKLGEGDYSERANTDSPAPIGGLASSFNAMADKIQQTIVEQDIMIGAIPHELRTPLSRLRFHSELARAKNNQAEFHASLDALDTNFDELEQVVDEILELIRLKHGATFEREPFALAHRIESIAEAYLERYPQIKIINDVPNDFMVSAHQDLLMRAIRNVVENAMKYANSRIIISATASAKEFTVDISDDGQGIPVQQREMVLSPFARLDESRHKDSGGIGLGLSLVKIIMDKHHGNIGVLDSRSGGALIRLSWPS